MKAQLKFEGGWWDVTVLSHTKKGAKYVVEACGYGIVHTVSADALRPHVA